VFGNAGGGKSTLARRLAEVTGLRSIRWMQSSSEQAVARSPHEEYLKIHADLLDRDQ